MLPLRGMYIGFVGFFFLTLMGYKIICHEKLGHLYSNILNLEFTELFLELKPLISLFLTVLIAT